MISGFCEIISINLLQPAQSNPGEEINRLTVSAEIADQNQAVLDIAGQ